MPRFSIIVPAIGNQSDLDDTLVSILENRPVDSEVIVACDHDYLDPYELDEEVTFIRSAATAATKRRREDWPALQNRALNFAQGQIVLTLMPGVTVLPGWEKPAASIFASRLKVAAVAPKIQSGNAHRTSIGVTFTGGGRRVPQLLSEADRPRGYGSGPSYLAGLYRGSALQEIGGWNVRIHPLLADIELALRLAKAGYRSKVAMNCHVSDQVRRNQNQSAYRLARDSQRLLREISGDAAGLGSLQPLALLLEIAGGRPLAKITGRIVGCRGALATQTTKRIRAKAA